MPMFRFGRSHDERSADSHRGVTRKAAAASRSGRPWLRRWGAGGSLLLLLSLFSLVGSIPALAAVGQVNEFPVPQGTSGTVPGSRAMRWPQARMAISGSRPWALFPLGASPRTDASSHRLARAAVVEH